jgi:trk system potassium uptake protein TrkH
LNTPLISISLYRRVLLVGAGLCGLLGLIFQYGTYEWQGLQKGGQVLSVAAMALFLTEQLVAWRELGSFPRYVRKRLPTFLLSVLLLLEGLGLVLGRHSSWLQDLLRSLRAGSVTHAYLFIVQFYILAIFAVELPHLHRKFSRTRVRPAVAFALIFAGLILVGTGLLSLPRAVPPDRDIALVDAFFTATSAVCVTGLVVRDTGSEFTTFGQVVILVLIQLGGLGIMSLTATLSLLLGRGIGVRESSLLREVLQIPMLVEAGRMVRTIILLTLACEAVGAFLLFMGLEGQLPGTGQRIYVAVFHSVSAFCNAGFSLFSDSLVSLAGNGLVMSTISVLLVVGGLGFGVLIQLLAWLRGRALRRAGFRSPLDLNSRVVLLVSAMLLIGGWALLAVGEWNGALAGEPWPQKLGLAFFQGATCRTAGFNSMDLNALSPAALFFMIILMFVGAAPGGTGGGVKVTTVAVIWANLRSVGSGLSRVRLWRREIAPEQVHRSLLVLSAFLVAAAVAIFLLLLTEGRGLLETAFEVFSALGTVGLSLGLTPELSLFGRILVALLMFVGRLGPLTLAGSLVGSAREPRVRLPRGQIMIG